MPPRRSFGTVVGGNSSRKPNLTPLQRQAIIAQYKAGVSVAELAIAFERGASTIRDTLKRWNLHATVSDLPRSGRKPILSLHQKKLIYRAARAAPKIEYDELAKVGVFVNAEGTPSKPPSRSTLYRVLKGFGLSNFRCKKRPKLNKAHAAKRLQFCRQYRTFQWSRRTLKFSDECSFQKCSGQTQE
jgi:transposase